MKTKSSSTPKKQNVAVKDLKTRKNPKGGISDQAAAGNLTSFFRGTTTVNTTKGG